MAGIDEQKVKEDKTFGEVISDSIDELKLTFIAFAKAPRALWGVYVPYILEGLVYFGILTILGKYCSENVSLNDLYAGYVYSGLTGGITLSMLLLGGLSDKLGIRLSLALALFAMLVGRVFVALSGTLGLTGGLWSPMFFMMVFGLLLVTLGYGLYQPAAYAGVKRYTDEKTASMGYAVIYGFMNLGAFFSGFISSFSRQNFEDVMPPNGLTAVFWIYVVLTAVAILASVLIITKKADKAAYKLASGKDESDDKKVSTEPKINNIFAILGIVVMIGALVLYRSDRQDYYLALAVLGFIGAIADYLYRRPDHPFRDIRFTFFIFILIPVQTLFAHNWLTVPYYLDRAFAGSFVSEYFEIFSNINPVLIFVLAPVVAGLTAKADVYKMMVYGTFVMAIPTFLLVLGPNPYLFLVYVLIMTIGEAMWQPRFLQWIAEIAPEGKTGMYMGVGQFPWFLTKVITGFFSGWFLTQYIPLDTPPEQMNSEFLWLVYGIIAMISPVGLVIAKKWMEKGFRTKQS